MGWYLPVANIDVGEKRYRSSTLLHLFHTFAWRSFGEDRLNVFMRIYGEAIDFQRLDRRASTAVA